MDWQTSIEAFIQYLQLERGYPANTLMAYKRDVMKLKSFLERNYPEMLPSDIIPLQIKKLLQFLSEIGLDATTQARTLSGIKTFFNFLVLEEEIEVSPAELIDTPKIAQKIPDTLSFTEIEQILSAIDLSEPSGPRDRAMFEVLYACGLRVTELCELKISQLFFNEGYIIVIGKGNKQRLIPIGADAMKYVNIYINQVRVHKKVLPQYNDFIFINSHGKPLSRIWVFLILKRLCFEAKIEKNVSPHTFRHSFATHLLEGGADLSVVQDLLGHSSITTTEIYTHLDKNYLREVIQMFHPMNQKKNLKGT